MLGALELQWSALVASRVTGLGFCSGASVPALLFYGCSKGAELCQDEMYKGKEIISPLFLYDGLPHGSAGSLQCGTDDE